MNKNIICDEENKGLLMEKYLVKDLKEDLKNSPVIKLDNTELKKKLDNYKENESLIIKYTINPLKTIKFIESCSNLLENF